MRVVFDENAPGLVARAVTLIAEAEAIGFADRLEVLHSIGVVGHGTPDISLIQAITSGAHACTALITCDKGEAYPPP